jgi:hypothetical protein
MRHDERQDESKQQGQAGPASMKGNRQTSAQMKKVVM